jgi:hypothetical protein
MMYPTVLRERYEDYFRIGRGFAKIIGRPAIMGRAARYMLPSQRVMNFAMRVMANLSDGPDGDRQDRLFHLMQRIARAA